MPRALLFDFNGVLIDDEHLHWRAMKAAVGFAGAPLPRAVYDRKYLAFDDRTAIAAVLRDRGIRPRRAVVEDLTRRKRAIYRDLAAGSVRVDPAVRRLLRTLSRSVPIAVVSGAARAEIELFLREARLLACISAIVPSEEMRRPKPDPSGYRIALSRLNVRGRRAAGACLAFEDSPGGIRAALAAGIPVIGVATSYPRRVLRSAGAVRVVARLEDLPAREILLWGEAEG
jgi:beta-phosphoglucomutase